MFIIGIVRRHGRRRGADGRLPFLLQRTRVRPGGRRGSNSEQINPRQPGSLSQQGEMREKRGRADREIPTNMQVFVHSIDRVLYCLTAFCLWPVHSAPKTTPPFFLSCYYSLARVIIPWTVLHLSFLSYIHSLIVIIHIISKQRWANTSDAGYLGWRSEVPLDSLFHSIAPSCHDVLPPGSARYCVGY